MTNYRQISKEDCLSGNSSNYNSSEQISELNSYTLCFRRRISRRFATNSIYSNKIFRLELYLILSENNAGVIQL